MQCVGHLQLRDQHLQLREQHLQLRDQHLQLIDEHASERSMLGPRREDRTDGELGAEESGA
eukprot:609602-Rhodomonas_salina.1